MLLSRAAGGTHIDTAAVMATSTVLMIVVMIYDGTGYLAGDGEPHDDGRDLNNDAQKGFGMIGVRWVTIIGVT